MSDKRLERLLAKELDGEISRVELEELERLALADPEARRRRSFWRSVESEMHREMEQPIELDLVRLARGIVTAGPAEQPRRGRRKTVALSVAAVLAVMVAGAPSKWSPEEQPVPAGEVASRDGFSEPPPVHVRVAREQLHDSEAPVTIRF
jgi:hypothetical protein